MCENQENGDRLQQAVSAERSRQDPGLEGYCRNFIITGKASKTACEPAPPQFYGPAASVIAVYFSSTVRRHAHHRATAAAARADLREHPSASQALTPDAVRHRDNHGQ